MINMPFLRACSRRLDYLWLLNKSIIRSAIPCFAILRKVALNNLTPPRGLADRDFSLPALTLKSFQLQRLFVLYFPSQYLMECLVETWQTFSIGRRSYFSPYT